MIDAAFHNKPSRSHTQEVRKIFGALFLENVVLDTADTNIIAAFNAIINTCYHYHYPM
jgi:nickel-dependent lactate racemase